MRFWGSDERDENRAREPENGSVAEMLATASDGIGEVVRAAERAVAKMRAYDEAAGEGDARINRERLVQELVRSVLERTAALRTEAGALAQILDRAGSKLQASSEAPAPTEPRKGEPAEPAEPIVDVAAGPAKFTGRGEAKEKSSISSGGSDGPPAEGVRLLATQMAVAGSDRAEVEHRLARDFGVRDAGYLLDELFSRESAATVD